MADRVAIIEAVRWDVKKMKQEAKGRGYPLAVRFIKIVAEYLKGMEKIKSQAVRAVNISHPGAYPDDVDLGMFLRKKTRWYVVNVMGINEKHAKAFDRFVKDVNFDLLYLP
ncbi:hypothetical protein GF382_00735 [Candidatus Falkowbacteria bacterium]|nr:hypothetical protein [Candidatus Falkowbacteria bacterium]